MAPGAILPSGSWSPSHVHIQYDNWSATALPWIQARDGTSANPHVIENLTINAGTSPTGNGILIEHSEDHFIVRNCTVTNASSTMDYGGIKLLNVTNGRVLANNCSRNRGCGILLQSDSDENVVEGNVACDNGMYGLLLDHHCDRNLVRNNVASCKATLSQYNGIQIYYYCLYNNVTGNTANNNIQNGIRIAGDCESNRVWNNRLESNMQDGLVCEVSDNNVVLGNAIHRNQRYGIYLSASRACTIEANVVSSSIVGIRAQANYVSFFSDHHAIRNNVIGATNRGIDIYNSDNNTVSSNTITSSRCGIFVYETERSSIEGNHVTGNDTGDVGINIFFQNKYHNVTGNTIDGCSDGVVLNNRVRNCHVISNQIYGGSGSGILINQSSACFAFNNHICDSMNGIRVVFGNGTLLVGNDICGITTGIWLSTSYGSAVLSNKIVASGACIVVDSTCQFTTVSGNTCGETNDGGEPSDLNIVILTYAIIVSAALAVVILSWALKGRKKIQRAQS